MAVVHVTEEIPAPANAVWAMIGDLQHPGSWPAVESCELEGQGVGCVRTLRLTSGEVIRERFEEHDDRERRYADGERRRRPVNRSRSVNPEGPADEARWHRASSGRGRLRVDAHWRGATDEELTDLVRGMQAAKPEAELAEVLSQQHDISLAGAARDVSDFVSRLKSMQLL